MRRPHYAGVAGAGLLACLTGCTALTALSPVREAPIFFDDFSPAGMASLANRGWLVRDQAGHPGIAGAQWGPDTVQLVPDPSLSGNGFLRLQASTDGTAAGTRQAQVCHQRRYLEGTYAARVRFSDAPDSGPDGDVVIQSFYLVSPLRYDLDPEFSEMDFEYLPNGGWGDARTRLYAITWQTVQIEPWKAFNQAHQEYRSLGGWHTLVMQIAGGKTRHYLDGVQLSEHGGRNYPVVPMSLNFNLWFSPGGELPSERSQRVYTQDIDWVFHSPGLHSPEQVEMAVGNMRSRGIAARDTIAASEHPLPSLCNF